MTLVISPLLALMRDQLQRLPPCLPAAMLWGGQSVQEAQAVLQGGLVPSIVHGCPAVQLSP